jgi:hypothetical protein
MWVLTLGILVLWRSCAWIPWVAGYGVVSESDNPRILALVVGLAIILFGGCVTALRMATRLRWNPRELAGLSGAGRAISLIGPYFLWLDIFYGSTWGRVRQLPTTAFKERFSILWGWGIILWLCLGTASGASVGLYKAWRLGG